MNLQDIPPIYHLHLIANEVGEIGKLFGYKHYERNDLDAGWTHCALTVDVLALFIYAIIHKREGYIREVNRCVISRFSQSQSSDPLTKDLLAFRGGWDANEKELEYLNSGFSNEEKDKERLVSFIVDCSNAKRGYRIK